MPKAIHSQQRDKRDKPWIWISIALVLSLVALSGIFKLVDVSAKSTSNGFLNILNVGQEEEQQITEDERQVVPVGQSAATQFVKNLASIDVPGYGVGAPKNTGTAGTVVSWICGNITMNPAPAIGMELSFPSQVTAIIQAYGAGQSVLATDNYKEGIKKCANRNGSARFLTSSPAGVTDAYGFLFSSTSSNTRIYTNVWVRGDAVISMSHPDRNALADLSVTYDAYVQENLTNTQCLSFAVNTGDSTRSPYYDFASYTGWNKGREVSVYDKSAGVTLGSLSNSTDVKGPGIRLGQIPEGASKPNGETNISLAQLVAIPTKPEAPLPENYATELPTPVEAPENAPTIPEKPAPVVVIPERVADEQGPGCGWAWSGQAAPLYDATAEKERADGEAASTKEMLRGQYTGYLSQYVDYYNTYINYSFAAHQYNMYAESLSVVSQQWNYVNDQRKIYRDALDKYYADVTAREKFIVDRDAAQIEYDALVQQCVIQDAEDAANAPTPEPTEEPTPDPTPSPTEPTQPTPAPSDSPSTPAPSEEPTQQPSPTPTSSRQTANISFTAFSSTMSSANDPAAPVPSSPETNGTPPPRITCPVVIPEILQRSEPPVPVLPVKPDVPLPASWTDVP